MSIRKATADDLKSINQIYNQAVFSKLTADTSPINIENRKEWFNEHEPKTHPVFVYTKNEIVIGWISFSAYREGRQALRQTAEISFYIDSAFQKQGIGTELINFAIRAAPEYGFRNLFAIILERNLGSIKLMEKCNFVRWGFLPKVANFDGELCGHFYYGLNF